jgi:hypothetical protein
MGFSVSPGPNVPPCLGDATEFGDLLDRLHGALQRPPTFSGALNPSLLANNAAKVS